MRKSVKVSTHWRTRFCNIEGIDKVELLKRCWEHSHPAAFYEIAQSNGHEISPPNVFDYELAKEFLSNSTYVDYFQGRAIKMHFSWRNSDFCNPSKYDEYTQPKTFEKILETFD